MFKYGVSIEQRCVKDYHSGERYGDWESEYDNSFDNIHRLKDNEHGDIESTLDLKDGDKCWVVWVEYSSGDSFGRGIRNDVEAIAVFVSEDAAHELKIDIESNQKNKNDYSHILLNTSDGQELDIYPVWRGYFERLDEVHVERAIVGETRKRRF